MGITPSISTSSEENSEDEDVDLEYIFHQRLTWMILGLSPIVFMILIRQTLPTYGKHSMHNNHNHTTQHKESSSLEQKQHEISKEKNKSTSSSHSTPSSSSTTLSSSSRTTLRHRRNKNKNRNNCTDTDGTVEVEEEKVSTKRDDADAAEKDQRGSDFEDAESSSSHDNNTERRRTEKRRTLLHSFHYWFFSPLLPPNIAWFLFESPCWIWVLLCLYDHHYHVHDSVTDGSSSVGGDQERQQQQQSMPIPTLPSTNQLLLGWFFFHYIYRSIIYPCMMTHTTTTTTNHKRRKGFPIGVAFVAWLYCVMNGYLQARYLTKFYCYTENGTMMKTMTVSSASSSSSFDTIHFWVGFGLIVLGFSIVVSSDCILLNLKKQQQCRKKKMTQNVTDDASVSTVQSYPPQHQYSIPYGGFFYFVSSPHYFGEILEWSGFCLAASTSGGPHSSFCALSFVIWTGANLIPRALHTHEWYQDTFQNNTTDNNNDNNTPTHNKNDGNGNGTILNGYIINDNAAAAADGDDDTVDYSQLNRKAIIPFIL